MKNEKLETFRQNETMRLLKWISEGDEDWYMVEAALEYDIVTKDIDGKWFARCMEILMERSFYFLIPIILKIAQRDRASSLAINSVIFNQIAPTMDTSDIETVFQDFIKSMYAFQEKETSFMLPE